MNNKGITVVELIVSFALAIIVALFLIETVIYLRDIYITTGINTTLINKQSVISNRINKDFSNKRIVSAKRCGTDCLYLKFNDSTEKTLSINKNNNTIIFGDYTNKLPVSTVIGTIVMDINTISGVGSGKYNSIFRIYIPITDNISKNKKYDINVIYQFDNRVEALTITN